MAFVADANGNLHDVDRASPACEIGPEGTRYADAKEAWQAQRDENLVRQAAFEERRARKPLTVQHFCTFCMPGLSWSDMIPELIPVESL